MPGRTTRGFLPGPIPAGRWEAELGRRRGRDARAGRRRPTRGLAPRDRASRATPRSRPAVPPGAATTSARAPQARLVRRRPARPRRALGTRRRHDDARSFDYAFSRWPRAARVSTSSRSPTTSTSSGVGRDRPLPAAASAQPRHPQRRDHHLPRAHRTTTPRDHYVDHRTGPVYDARPDGSADAAPRRAARRARSSTTVHRAGGFTQINHPTIFPSSIPAFAAALPRLPVGLQRRARRDLRKVDAIEVNTGPQKIGEAPNPFTTTAIDFYEMALAAARTSRRSPPATPTTPARRATAPGSRRSGPARPSSTRSSSPSAASAARSRPATPTRRSRVARARTCASPAALPAPAGRRSSATPSAAAGSRSPRGRRAAACSSSSATGRSSPRARAP